MPDSSANADLPSPWHDWYNASVYQSYIDEFPIYPWLNRQLAQIAELPTARRILDLACGTGATALACLPEMHRDAELVGIDTARPMVEIARAEVRDPRCRFVVGASRELSRRLEGRFDRVICNAAFWQLDEPRDVLAELSRVLRPGARLAFSIPTQYLDPDAVQIHPFQRAVARHLGSAEPADPIGGGPFDSIDRLADLLRRGGFRPVRRTEVHHQGEQRELVDLMRIPAMARSIAPERGERVCSAAIAKAAAEVDPTLPVQVTWTLVAAIHEGAANAG